MVEESSLRTKMTKLAEPQILRSPKISDTTTPFRLCNVKAATGNGVAVLPLIQ